MRFLLGSLVGFFALFAATGNAAERRFAAIDLIAENTVATGQWVRLDESGSVHGTVVAAGLAESDLTGSIVLKTQQGESFLADVDTAGKFSIAGVAPGVYSLIYKGEMLFAALALHVTEKGDGDGQTIGAVIPAAALDPQRAIATIARYQPARLNEQVNPATGIESPADVDATPNSGIAQVMRNVGGGISGRLVCAGMTENGAIAASGLNVLVLQDGKVCAQTVSSVDGTFSTEQLDVGRYGLIISGAMGYAVVGVELIDAPEILTGIRGADVNSLVSAWQSGAAAELVLQVAGPDPSLGGDDNQASGPTVFAEPLPTLFESGVSPMSASSGFPSGGSAVGGGGGGGGFGGGGGLVGLAGMGAVLAALSGDDNGNFVPSVTSPAVP